MASRPNLRLVRRAAPVALLTGILLLAAACAAPALPAAPTAERGVGVSAERGPDSPATQEPAGTASPAAGGLDAGQRWGRAGSGQKQYASQQCRGGSTAYQAKVRTTGHESPPGQARHF